MTAVLHPKSKKDSWTDKNIVCRWDFVKFYLKTDWIVYIVLNSWFQTLAGGHNTLT